jgi:16S rRNA processing protein RimM
VDRRSDGRLAIGRLGAPHGVHGDLKVKSYSGEFAHFRGLTELDLEPAQDDGSPSVHEKPAQRSLHLRVRRVEDGPGGLLLAFAGYDSPEAARVLTGLEIVVSRDKAAPLGPNEWYVADLIGMKLFSGGQALARVVSVVEGGSDPWLEAELEGGRRALVPFRKEFVGAVDIPSGSIELLAPWLLDP